MLKCVLVQIRDFILFKLTWHIYSNFLSSSVTYVSGKGAEKANTQTKYIIAENPQCMSLLLISTGAASKTSKIFQYFVFHSFQ